MNADSALTVLTASAQEIRLAAFRTLLRHMPDGLAAGHLAQAVGCAPSTLTFHLQHLAGAGLVQARRQAQSVVYFAVPETVGSLTNFLTIECCNGKPELCASTPGLVSCGSESVVGS